MDAGRATRLRAVSHWLALAGGAVLGAALRHALALGAARWWGSAFPYGTLIANLAGALLLGFFLAWAARHPALPSSVRLFVATGFCGSLTTFSTLSAESVALATDERWGAALLNSVGSLALGLLGVLLGAALARWLPL